VALCRLRSVRHLPHLPSFPTRRSSDLAMITNVVFFIVLSLSSAIPAAIRRHRTFTIAYYQGKGNFLSQRRAVGICLFLEYLAQRSEEHTSELQSRFDLVCRLLLEKQKA